MRLHCARAGGKIGFFTAGARDEFNLHMAHMSENAKVRLCGLIARENEFRGDGDIPFMSNSLNFVSKAESMPMPTVPERLDLALEWLVRKSNHIGDNPLMSNNGALNGRKFASCAAFSYSRHWDDLQGALNALEERGFVKISGGMKYHGAIVTAKGYAHHEESRRKAVDSSRAFVAMWFGGNDGEKRDMNAVYDKAIAPAIHDAGYEPVRVDREEHLGKIDDEIIAQIRRARFVVADFTAAEPDKPRGGVYYEAGFAYGLGREVVYTCRADFVDALHFDTRQFNHIVWHADQLPDFRKALRNRIERAIGVGPKKPPDDQDK